MSTSKLSFQEFGPNEKSDWTQQIEKELRGAEWSSLHTDLEGGIVLEPAYTKEDLIETVELPAKGQSHVDLVEAIEVYNESESNKKILDVLNRGASSILLYLQEDVDLSVLLKDVLIQHIAVHYVVEGNGSEIAKQIEGIAVERDLDLSSIRGSINIDPIENLARSGDWFEDEIEDFEELGALLSTSLSSMKTLCVNANLYHNAGATTSTELGLALAHGHEFIAKFGPEHAHRFWMNLAIGRNYLTEVAKFRAIRLLWAKLLEGYNADSPLHIYAETGLRNKTIFDPNVNMLRTTTEAMSALVGGADEVMILPYDLTYRTPTPLAQRIARNQALVMQYEAFATKVHDPASGSYAIETLTESLCEKAWDFFREIESKGGLLEGLKDGWIQSRIREEADAEYDAFERGDIVLVGTNKFPNKDEKMGEVATTPLFNLSTSDGDVIEKIQAVRLSESMERERLNAE
ncbi:methylmalonyl-CoA mutase family protein [Phaeocystidibacter luteus]|uniref:Methylmalonyl-CoA mutase alpha/beta chain catalytic domain-containing protein n=1 Tax=Phaeocystidibacter luteus TaxID=911197 RepID=A0A6N6RKA2_9FLAO|nr:methylmalonyl-CoA mutase family protein [Phaeocystidibacter luteus]KAB2809801.1 hypothetical protein F8C67_09605 [Phaeocystidibacter luteus]